MAAATTPPSFWCFTGVPSQASTPAQRSQTDTLRAGPLPEIATDVGQPSLPVTGRLLIRRADRVGRVTRRGVVTGRLCAMDRQQEFVLRTIEERDIRFVRLWFTDVLGTLKSVAVAPAELEGAFAEGIGFDGSAIEGFARVYEADMLAKPDPSTFQVLPWRGENPGTARMFCDIHLPDGSPSLADPRFVLKRALAKAADLGYTFYTHPEIEFFVLQAGLRARQAAGAGRPGGLLRPRAARHDPRLPPRGHHDARVDGHLGRVQPSRGRAGPERDRPAVRRCADHRGQHHDLPHGHQGGRPGAGRLCDLHAETLCRSTRVRACTPT